jgi:hypothetical protein
MPASAGFLRQRWQPAIAQPIFWLRDGQLKSPAAIVYSIGLNLI